MGQPSGLILARIGLSGNFNPISGNAIRMITAAVLLWGVTFIQGNASKIISSLRINLQAQFLLITGVLTGPVLGVSYSLDAIQKAVIGVASTLMALSPVFLLPISKFYFKEQFGWGAVAGTLVAILGVRLLFLV